MSHQNETVQQESLQIDAETSKHDAESSRIPDLVSFINNKKEVFTLLEMWVSEFYHLTLFYNDLTHLTLFYNDLTTFLLIILTLLLGGGTLAIIWLTLLRRRMKMEDSYL